MAGIGRKCFQSILNSPNVWWSKSPCIRCYAVFPPSFEEPVIDKAALENIIKEQSKEEILGRKILPAKSSDTCSVFYHPDVEKFVNYAMRNGNKHISNRVVRRAFTRVKHIQVRKYNNETDPEKKKEIILSPLEMFLLAVKNVTPMLWYTKIKRSGTWYKVPTGISEERAKGIALKWLLEVSSDKDDKIPLDVQLAYEIIAAANYEGRTVAKKIELHKMCEANRSYVNYWWT